MKLAVAALGLLLGLAGPGGKPTFENRVFGHALRVPDGWTARLSPSGATNVLTYPPRRLDSFEQPPRGHLRIVLADYGRGACPPDAIREGEPIRLGGRDSFEGFVGYTVALCRRGRSLQAFLPAGVAVPPRRLAEARRILASVRLTPRADEIANERSTQVLGRSLEGRPIGVWRIGNPRGRQRVLVVGCIHGNECAGVAVTQRLVNLVRPIETDLWAIQYLNRDGYARRSRFNGRGVDLNRDFLAATQRETRIARKLILRLRPDVTIWFHQPQSLVRAWGPSREIARRYARLAGIPYRSIAWPPGTASHWQNGVGMRSFVVELPPGELSNDAALRHARAVLTLLP